MGSLPGNITGVHGSAFNMIGLAVIGKLEKIVCSSDNAEVDEIKKLCEVAVLEDENFLEVLFHDRDLIKPGSSLLVYKSSTELEEHCRQHGVKLLANPKKIRSKFEVKKNFYDHARAVGLPLIPGEMVDGLSETQLDYFSGKYGEKLVFQVVNKMTGAGRGTYIIDNALEFKAMVREVKSQTVKMKVAGYLEGEAVSVLGVITKEGVLVGPLQRQLIDVKDVLLKNRLGGVFCGHDWSVGYPDDVIKEVELVVRKLAKQMQREGYKGIFGVDMLIKDDEVFVVECNARYTSALPVLTMLQHEAGEVSFEELHVLEFLDRVTKEMVEAVSLTSMRMKRGAQLILRTPLGEEWEVGSDVRAGVYQIHSGKLSWVRGGIAVDDIVDQSREFIIAGEISRRGSRLQGNWRLGKRLCRLIFKRRISVSAYQLEDDIKLVVRAVYDAILLKAREIEHYGD